MDNKVVIADVAFIVLFLVMVDAYKEIVPISSFDEKLLRIYQNGFLPCGWEGSNEDGCFIIF